MVHGDTLLVYEKDKCQANGKNLAIVSLFLIVLLCLEQTELSSTSSVDGCLRYRQNRQDVNSLRS